MSQQGHRELKIEVREKNGRRYASTGNRWEKALGYSRAVRVGIARLPAGVDWKSMVGAGFLAGIGFTMSLFIANLALKDQLLDAAKVGTLAGSAISAIVGFALLRAFLPGQAKEAE